MKYLRKATAATVAVGPFVSKADGFTPVTSLTTGSTLNGRAVSNGIGAAYVPATLTHDANGHYLAALATGDVPTAGRLRLDFSDPATYCPVWEDFIVLEPAVYDALFGTVALSTYAGGAVTVGAYATGMDPATLVLATPANKIATDGTGRVTAGTVADKAGYSLLQAFPANFASMAITTGGIVQADVQTILTHAVTCPAGVTFPTTLSSYAGGDTPGTTTILAAINRSQLGSTVVVGSTVTAAIVSGLPATTLVPLANYASKTAVLVDSSGVFKDRQTIGTAAAGTGSNVVLNINAPGFGAIATGDFITVE
jgi:hypothetical protein